MKKLSVVIITFNESINIEDCLKSVVNVADEIIVVDSFSTDDTEEICKKYNVSFYKHKFEGYIEQKNRALTYSNYDYVLSLDADERLSPELQEQILEEKKDFKFDAYYFNRQNIYCGKKIKHSDWYPDRKLRLWNKQKGMWAGENPHDKVTVDKNANAKIIKKDILHYSFRSIKEHVNQINNFSEIGAMERFKKGKRSNLVISIGKAYWKFIKSYFIKLGILDGYYGVVICTLSSQETFIKYLKLRELTKNKK